MSETSAHPDQVAACDAPTVQPGGQAVDLPLEQFAAIEAGVIDGFPLAELLEQERIDEPRWLKSRAEHIGQIATDPDVYLRYQAALEAHQDKLFCPVSPLYDEVGAWVAFVERADQTPAGALCAELGIILGDMARLERHWRLRLRGDAKLAREARTLRQDARRPALPPLEVGERRYLPWGETPPDDPERLPPNQ